MARGSVLALAVAGLAFGVVVAPPAADADPDAGPGPDNAAGAAADASAADASAADASAAPDPASRQRIQQELDEMVRAGAPGVYARITDEHGTWTARSGTAELGTDRPMPQNGSFRPASITKSLTATVVLQLVESGELALDDRVQELLPGVVPGGEEITVRQLLEHTSGLPEYMNDPAFDQPSDYVDRHFTPDDLVGLANQQDPTGKPGEAWSYTNTGYILLGMIVEDKTGRRLPDVLEERVLDPAGMRDSYLAQRPGEPRGPHAKGYHLPVEGPTGEFTRIDPSFAWAAFGLVSTPEDIEKFYQALWSGKLLNDESLRRMTTTVSTEHPYFPGYGLGLESVRLSCSEPGLGHTGSIVGYSSFAFSSADRERQVTISVNAQIHNEQAAPVILAALDVINLEFCGEELPTPSGASERDLRLAD